MAIPLVPSVAELSPIAYGMGWFVTAYRGHFRVWHSGSIDGFCARVDLLPKDKIGIVVLTNLDVSPRPVSDLFVFTVAMGLYDRLLGMPPAPWGRRMRKSLAERNATPSPRRRSAAQGMPPLAPYRGRYRNRGYGHMEIQTKDSRLWVRFHGKVHAAAFKANSSFSCTIFGETTEIEFKKNSEGDVIALILDPGNGTRVRFRREQPG